MQEFLCIFNINFDMPATIRANVPTSVTPNEAFNINNSSATVVIPKNEVNTMRNLLIWNTVSGEVKTFEIHSHNQNGTINVADPIINIPNTPVPTSGDFELTVPSQGGITAGLFNAGTSGSITLTAGNIETTFVNPALGFLSPKLNANCEPLDEVDGQPQDLTLINIPIIAND